MSVRKDKPPKPLELSTLKSRASALRSARGRDGIRIEDPGEFLLLSVTIDDDSEQGLDHPCAVVKYKYSKNEYEERIDIIGSVESDAVLIGHPVILAAIERWQGFVHYRRVLSQANKTRDKKALAKSASYYMEGRYAEIGKKNLKRIGEALLQGAWDASLSRQMALYLYVTSRGIVKRDTFLRRAWELLGREILKGQGATGTKWEGWKVDEIEAELRRTDPSPYLEVAANGQLATCDRPGADESIDAVAIPIHQVVNFLKSSNGAPFLENRKRWVVMQNAFIAWRLGRGKEVAGYLNTARKAATNNKQETRNQRLGMKPHIKKSVELLDVLQKVLSTPLRELSPTPTK